MQCISTFLPHFPINGLFLAITVPAFNTFRNFYVILKDFSTTQVITSLSKSIDLTRVGIWNILKKLEIEHYITLKPIGTGKTSTYIVSLNWDNPLTERILALYLTEEALLQKRWESNFKQFATNV